MSSKAYAERLARALESTGLVQAVNSNYGDNQVRILCRVLQGGEAKWVNLVRQILLATEIEQVQAYAWQAHICRIYFLKENGKEKKLVFGWNISVHSPELSTALDFLTRVIRGEPPGAASRPPLGETEEMEFTGVSGERLPSPGGKGAYTIGGKNDFHFGRGVTK